MPRGRPFKPGHKKFGGRVAGQPNKITTEIRELLREILPRDELKRRWLKMLNSKDRYIMMKAFELAHHYLFGKPVQRVAGDEDAPPIKIDISAIPKFRVATKQ